MARPLLVLAIVVPCAGFFAPRVASRLVTPVMVEVGAKHEQAHRLGTVYTTIWCLCNAQGTPLGRPHTAESRAKISAANRGKTPWNKVRVCGSTQRSRTQLAFISGWTRRVGSTLRRRGGSSARERSSRCAGRRRKSSPRSGSRLNSGRCVSRSDQLWCENATVTPPCCASPVHQGGAGGKKALESRPASQR